MPLLSTTRQLPKKGEIFLDHVGWMVPDMTGAAPAFERLGFQLTPYSVHGDRDKASGELKPAGTANRLIMLETGYLEILTPVDGIDTPVARHMRDCIKRGVGIHLIAFTVADAKEEASRVAEAGFTLQPTVNLRRTIEAQNGSETEVAFTVMRASFDALPEARVQVLTHHTPDEVWQPRYLSHKIAVTGLAEVYLATEDPAKTAEGFSRFTGRPVTTHSKNRFEIILDRGRLIVLKHDVAPSVLGGGTLAPPPTIAAITLTCTNLHEATRTLEKRGIIPIATEEKRTILSAADGVGSRIVLQENT